MYAILKITEYYGPRTEQLPITDDRNRVICYASRARAEHEARNLAGAESAEYGCPMLANGQASAPDYVVRRINPSAEIWRGAWLPDAITA
jgi:hypothetical protein